MKVFDSFKKDTQMIGHIELGYKVIIIVLLAVIAYNTTYFKSILKEIEINNREKQIVVNVNNNGQQGAPVSSAPLASTPVSTAATEQTAPSKTTVTTPKKAQAPKKSKEVEANPNPTTYKVEMLNNSPEGAMVFSPPYIQIKPGDSVEFIPASYGHNVQTPEDIIGSDEAIPKGAKPFKSAMNEKLIVKFTQPGVYLYVCNYHYIVGHVGVIQVGNDSHNLETVKEAGDVLKSKIFSHPDRVDKYLDMVKVD